MIRVTEQSLPSIFPKPFLALQFITVENILFTAQVEALTNKYSYTVQAKRFATFGD